MVGDLLQAVKDLKTLALYTGILFVIFILVPIFISPYLLLLFESSTNNQMTTYWATFEYTYEIIMGVDISKASIITSEGKILVGILALFKLIFLGFLASIVTTYIQLKIKLEKVPRPKE
jgi:asparagine N-glycosylation enzyme membrane subunit Stt3